MAQTLYSIGHGRKTIIEFEDELKSFGISYLIDVRTKPYSKWSPDFNQDNLKKELSSVNIRYVYMGDTLGGLPKDPSCYTNGHVDYSLVSKKDFFIKGLGRLITAYEKGLKVAVMCSESDPTKCHRSKLIGRELLKHNIVVNHILSKNQVKDQNEILLALNDGFPDMDLFGQTDSKSSYSRKTYL